MVSSDNRSQNPISRPILKIIEVLIIPFRFVRMKRKERIEKKERAIKIEKLRVQFDPKTISREDLLRVFTSRDQAFEFALASSAELDEILPSFGDLAVRYLLETGVQKEFSKR